MKALAQFLLLAILAAGMVVSQGCDGGGNGGPTTPSEPAAPETPTPGSSATPAPAASAAATATIKGVTKFTGTAPALPDLKISGDPFCTSAHPTPVKAENVVIGADGTLENVFVYVKSGVTGSFDPPQEPVVLDQKSCMYSPHILGMMVKQSLVVRNSDKTNHNINVKSRTNRGFNVSQIAGQKDIEKDRFARRAEGPIPVICNQHSWMNMYVWVREDPYFAVAGKGGAFELPAIKPGKYTVAAWHETFGELTQEIEVKENETKELTFEFTGK